MARSVREIIDESRMSALQIAAVAVTIGLNALDGFDVLSISFASPGIASDWGIDRAALGIVLSMELIGMAVGSVLLGGVADAIGRRPTILGCLVLMLIGMIGAAFSQSVVDLSAWRVATGIGIGGMLAAINAVAAEFSNKRWRSVCMSLMVIGYPLGAVIGGSIAALLLQHADWRAVFLLGAGLTGAFLPLVFFLTPESPAYLDARRPAGALERINGIFARMGRAPLEVLAGGGAPLPRKGGAIAGLFAPNLIAVTLLVTIAYFAHISAFYFILKWIPKIVVDMGFAASSAAGVLVWANLGGAVGGACFGLAAKQVGIKNLTILVLVASMGMLVWFGRGQADLAGLSMISAAAGFFTNAGVVGLYMLFAEAFPTHVRASGTGFAIGVGRGGAALAPALAGALFQAGFSLQSVSILLGAGSLIGAAALLFLRFKSARAPAAQAA